MTLQRRRRLYLVGAMVIGVAIALALTLSALEKNISLFYSPAQLKSGETPEQVSFRVGGMAVEGSFQRSTNSLLVKFDLTDTQETVSVHYAGILPDPFREGQGIVATGSLENGIFKAREVLAKHDENYMPPEVADALGAAKNAK